MLDREFFRADAITLAQALVGKIIVRRFPDGSEKHLRITETEAYCGTEDTACHAHKGKTKRAEILWRDGGTIYVYLCYGMHEMLNIVSGTDGDPQAVLIRCCEGFEGPGKLTKELGIDRSLNGLDILYCDELSIENDGTKVNIMQLPRVGIAYADPADREALWRFKLQK
jgi:DNA-3-methyladenine glycosylase